MIKTTILSTLKRVSAGQRRWSRATRQRKSGADSGNRRLPRSWRAVGGAKTWPERRDGLGEGRLGRRERDLCVSLRGGRLAAGSCSDVAQVANDFQDFAAGGKHPPIGPLVSIQGLHELDFVCRIIALASGGVDLATTRDLPPFHGHRNVLFTAVLLAPVDLYFFVALGHGSPL